MCFQTKKIMPSMPWSRRALRAITDMTASHELLYSIHTIEEAHPCCLINDLGFVSEAHYSWSCETKDDLDSVILDMTVQGPQNIYNFKFHPHQWRWLPDNNLCVCFWPINVMHLCHRPWRIQLSNETEVKNFMQFLAM